MPCGNIRIVFVFFLNHGDDPNLFHTLGGEAEKHIPFRRRQDQPLGVSFLLLCAHNQLVAIPRPGIIFTTPRHQRHHDAARLGRARPVGGVDRGHRRARPLLRPVVLQARSVQTRRASHRLSPLPQRRRCRWFRRIRAARVLPRLPDGGAHGFQGARRRSGVQGSVDPSHVRSGPLRERSLGHRGNVSAGGARRGADDGDEPADARHRGLRIQESNNRRPAIKRSQPRTSGFS